MKNFSDLLATNFVIRIDLVLDARSSGPVQVVINTDIIYDDTMTSLINLHHTVDLLEPIDITISHRGAYLKSLQFDGWEARPQHAQEIDGVWRFQTSIPFYQWKHHATSQGWLLTPQVD
jgi:hypothetical protein